MYIVAKPWYVAGIGDVAPACGVVPVCAIYCCNLHCTVHTALSAGRSNVFTTDSITDGDLAGNRVSREHKNIHLLLF
jgi:hypothetical protein